MFQYKFYGSTLLSNFVLSLIEVNHKNVCVWNWIKMLALNIYLHLEPVDLKKKKKNTNAMVILLSEIAVAKSCLSGFMERDAHSC